MYSPKINKILLQLFKQKEPTQYRLTNFSDWDAIYIAETQGLIIVLEIFLKPNYRLLKITNKGRQAIAEIAVTEFL